MPHQRRRTWLFLVLLLRADAVLEGVRPAQLKPKTLLLKPKDVLRTPSVRATLEIYSASKQSPPLDVAEPPLASNLASTLLLKPTDELRTPSVLAPMPDTRPSWFKAKAPGGPGSRYAELRDSIDSSKLNTVCDEAACPNAGECWEGGTATIMLLGDSCTRGCRFCNVKTDLKPAAADPDEPLQAAMAVASWGVDYIVLTSVDRDDMADGGSAHFAKTVRLLKELQPSILVECLVSDYAGASAPVEAVATCGLDVYAHNIETVERLQRSVRDPRATYKQSLLQLKRAKAASKDAPRPILTKTSLMLGLGETRDELRRAMFDLRQNGVDVVTFGQYLRPTERHLSVVEYVHPEVFEELREEAEDMGFEYCASGPMVRSSSRPASSTWRPC
jgi:lipoic acid synthetase